MSKKAIRLGLMGFGRAGRKIYDLASQSDDLEVVAIADIGEPEILHYLLCTESDKPETHTLEGNFLINPRFKARVLAIDFPSDVPWDAFDVDMVIDATGVYRETDYMFDHLSNGAPRVLMRTLPIDPIDRIVIPGVNENTIQASDRIISAGSSSTSALCLLLHILSQSFEIDYASMTTVHAYTSDQALQDYAGLNHRRSRSAARNIIPNAHEAELWVGDVLPQFANKVMTSALNIPVHEGCLLDLNLVMKDSNVSVEDINEAMRASKACYPGIVDIAEDPIVSSDILGNSHSLMFDVKGTLKAGDNIIKTLSWYETLGHVTRMLDVVRLYSALDQH